MATIKPPFTIRAFLPLLGEMNLAKDKTAFLLEGAVIDDKLLCPFCKHEWPKVSPGERLNVTTRIGEEEKKKLDSYWSPSTCVAFNAMVKAGVCPLCSQQLDAKPVKK